MRFCEIIVCNIFSSCNCRFVPSLHTSTIIRYAGGHNRLLDGTAFLKLGELNFLREGLQIHGQVVIPEGAMLAFI
jgi:hypothetical protein